MLKTKLYSLIVLSIVFSVKLNYGEVSEALFQRLMKWHCMKSMFTKTHVTIDRGLGVILKARLGL